MRSPALSKHSASCSRATRTQPWGYGASFASYMELPQSMCMMSRDEHDAVCCRMRTFFVEERSETDLTVAPSRAKAPNWTSLHRHHGTLIEKYTCFIRRSRISLVVAKIKTCMSSDLGKDGDCVKARVMRL